MMKLRLVHLLVALFTVMTLAGPVAAQAPEPVETEEEGASLPNFFLRLFWPRGHVGTAGTLPAPCLAQFTGPVGGLADTTRIAIAAAIDTRGSTTTPDMVGITTDSWENFAKFNVALTPNMESRHTTECLGSLADAGALAPYSLVGAEWFLFGAVQRSGSLYRVTVRLVDVETGVIRTAGKGDGPSVMSAAEAAFDALESRNVQFGQPMPAS